MQYRPLGSTGYTTSEIGLGTWQLGADWGDRPDEKKAFAILETAVESGVNLFDTADVYGDGRSEQLIGKYLKETGHDVFVATKFGRGGGVYPNGYSLESMRNAVTDSLQRLGRERLDLLQLHCIPTEWMQGGEVWDWLRELQSQGLIHHFGASVESVEEGLLCMERAGCATLQVILNAFTQRPARDLLPRAAAEGVGVLVRVPLASGLLTGKFTKDTIFAKEDHRNYNRDGAAFHVGETFSGLPFERGVDLADRVENELLPEGYTMPQLALRWVLDQEGVSTVIPGASRPEQVRSNAAVSDLAPLPKPVHAGLREFYEGAVAEHVRGHG